jgi:peptide/nickel transport system substrate-binding protein
VKLAKRRLLVPLVVALAVLGAATVAGARTQATSLVFGTSSDPVVLDGALVSDGESLRVIDQMFEGLVGLKPGTTQLEPALATGWQASKNGLSWTFTLRKGVKFHDGTPFDANAVCFNFNRWYSFTGSFQNPDATYYWQTVFGGFKNPEKGNPGPDKSLYKGCKAHGKYSVSLLLTHKSSSFFGALSLSNFGIASPTALKKYDADKGEVDSNGVFHPTGTYGTQHPVGTGPYMFKSWTVGQKLELVKNPNYWGAKAKIDRIIFRPIANNSARLQALQTGEVQGYDLVAPQDIPTIQGSNKLKVLSRPAFNVAYVGINQSKPPMDKLAVRQALAYGLDRASVVKSFYAGRAVVAKEFMPPQVQGYAKDVATYDYNPDKAKQLLQSAGLKLPVQIDFWYPTSISRPYMPDPKRNFEAFSASLEQSGFKVVPHSAPWRPDYLSAVDNGDAQVYLLGWTGDYGDPDNFIGTFFQTKQDAWGFNNSTLFSMLDKAEAETNLAKRVKEYQAANRYIMKFLPGIPYAHSSPALGFQNNVQGYKPSPVSLEPFSLVSYGSGK